MTYKTLKELFTGICDAVRVKKGITEEIDHQDIPAEILDIPSVDVSGVTATVSDVVAPKVFVDSDGVEQTGTIPTNSSNNLTADGATVSVPAGYYPTEASKSVETAEQATPNITVDSDGLITAKSTQSAGYVAAGTNSGTKQLTTQAAKTVTPTKSEQTAVAAGVFTTGAVKVAKIPDSYIQPSGTKSITENGTHDVTSFASVEVNVAGSGGGGGSAEMCTVEIMTEVPVRDTTITWLDTNGNVHQANYLAMDIMMGITLEVAYNSFIYSTSPIIIDTGDMSSPGLTTAGSQGQLIHVMASGTFFIN